MAALPHSRGPALAAAGVAALGLIAVWGRFAPYRVETFMVVALACGLAGAAYLAWTADPAWTLSLGLAVAVFGGNWDRLGLPSEAAPDRFLLLAGLLAVIFRGPGARLRPTLRISGVAWLMLAGVVYVVVSAVMVGTIGDRAANFVLLERFGIIPFLLFVCAPAVFATEAQRNVLLAAIVVIGAYLGLIAIFQGFGAEHLVFPAYIGDPSVGTHFGRARGPFLEAGTNGLAMFTCGCAAAVALAYWRRPLARAAAGIVIAMSAAGVLCTVTRQVWIGAILGTVVGMLMVPATRRLLIPALLVMALASAALLTAVPELGERASERRAQQGPIDDRVNQIHAAVNAVEEHPLFGVGWQNFVGKNDDYVELDPNLPLSGTRIAVHNVPLTYASELGLVGLVFWLGSLVAGIGGALRLRGPASARPWKAFLAAVFTCYVIVANFQFASTYPNLIIWSLAGLVVAASVSGRAERRP